MKTTLLAAAAISAMIGQVGVKGKELSSLIHDTAVQTVLHAEQHGDATLAHNLVMTVKDNMPGYVWQGLVKWYRTYSPIAWDAKGEVYLLKEGQQGYKPFASEEAASKPAANDAAVKNRTDREIEPFSIGMMKKQIGRWQGQLDKALKEDGRGVIGDAESIKTFINGVKTFADKIVTTQVVENVHQLEVTEKPVIEEGARAAA